MNDFFTFVIDHAGNKYYFDAEQRDAFAKDKTGKFKNIHNLDCATDIASYYNLVEQATRGFNYSNGKLETCFISSERTKIAEDWVKTKEFKKLINSIKEVHTYYFNFNRAVKKEEICHYKKGLRHGKEIRFNRYKRPFNIRSITHYKNGLRHGKTIHWYDNGVKELEMGYKDGKRHGKHVLRYTTGCKKAVSEYHNDILISRSRYLRDKIAGESCGWYLDGRKKYVNKYKDGKRHGLSVSWHQNGRKRSQCRYRHGKLHRTSTFWLPNGRREKLIEYRNGKQYGEVKIYS